MNKLFLLFLIFNYSVLEARIHTKNQNFIEIGVGTLDGLSIDKADNSGRWLSLSISKYRSKSIYLSLRAIYNEKFYKPNVQALLTNQFFFFDATVGKGLFFTPKKKLFLNIGVRPLLGYELISIGEYLIDSGFEIKNKSKILAGSTFEANIEFLLGTNFSVLTRTGLIWLPTSSVQNTHLLTGFGLRYNYF